MTVLSSQRLKFSSFEFERFPKGRCRASVGLEHPDGTLVIEAAEGISAADTAAELRCAAQATIVVLGKFVGDACSLNLLGVKAIKAFGNNVVIVALSVREDDQFHRLVGSVLAEKNPERSAALAVLDATNRFMGRLLFHH